jgi:hypothetical protein
VAQRPPLAGLDDAQRETAMRRWAVLRPHLQERHLPEGEVVGHPLPGPVMERVR